MEFRKMECTHYSNLFDEGVGGGGGVKQNPDKWKEMKK